MLHSFTICFWTLNVQFLQEVTAGVSNKARKISECIKYVVAKLPSTIKKEVFTKLVSKIYFENVNEIKGKFGTLLDARQSYVAQLKLMNSQQDMINSKLCTQL